MVSPDAAERSGLIQRLFDEALEHSPGKRSGFLQQACPHDADVRREVSSLIEAYDAHGDEVRLALGHLLPVDPASSVKVSDDSLAGRTIAHYQILKQIGRGGMGEVYLALREQPFRQYVAVKHIRQGVDAPELLRRFQLERQILASLNHRSVARLLDGGTTDDGLAYLVMEYVDGKPLTRFCDERRLSLLERLHLFQEVCQAVHYAHQNLIVHRDLKPSNILVTDDGQVKLLDFGVAKLLNPTLLSVEIPVTRTPFQMMTPEYAAPEQVRSETITTAADVYALGVLLYELLTGHRPYRLENRSAAEIERIICEQEVERPSLVVGRHQLVEKSHEDLVHLTASEVARLRGLPVERLRRQLRGDLDNIVLKALRKEPERRYDSAAEMGEDVRRYLAGLPVMARKDSASYRAQKFVRRHRVAVSLTAVVALSLIAGIVATGWQARVAREQAEAARVEATKAERINAFVQEMLSSVNPENQGRDVRVAEVLRAASEKVETELTDEPEVEAAVRRTIGLTYLGLGLYGEAEQHLERALVLRRALFGREHPEVATSLNDRATILWYKGDYVAAEPLFQEALAMRRKLFGQEHPEVAQTLNNLAAVVMNKGDYTAAEPLFREAHEMQRKLLGLENQEVAQSLNNVAFALTAQGKYADAEELLWDAIEIRKQVHGPEHPGVALSMHNQASVLHHQGDYLGAEALNREALAMRRRLLGEEHYHVSESLHNLARDLHAQGNHAEARSLYSEAFAMQRMLLGEEHLDVAETMNDLARLLNEQGDSSEAERLLRGALAMQRKLLGQDHPHVAESLYNLGVVLEDRGDVAASELLYSEAIELLRNRLPQGHPLTASSLLRLGLLMSGRSDAEGAEPLLREAVEFRRGTLPGGHWQTAEAESVLGGCLVKLQRYEQAEALLVQSYTTLKNKRGEADRETRRALEHLIGLYESWGRPEEASFYRSGHTAPRDLADRM